MKVNIDLYRLEDKEPEQDERVMVWDEHLKQWSPQCYNKEYDCWDTEDGDDYAREFNPQDIWFSLPSNPNNI